MKIALCGLGKAGTQVIRSLREDPAHQLSIVFCRNGSTRAGKSIKDYYPSFGIDCPICETKEAAQVLERTPSDVLIDFSSKKATLSLLPVCAKNGVAMVVCTTGFSEAELALMEQTGRETPGFALAYAPNITLGVNVMMMLAREAAQCLPGYDYAITEKHHRRKLDISATAQRMADGLEDILDKPVTLNSIRAGGYVGLHELLIASEFERVTIIHESFSRQAFASGALVAAEYLAGRSGYYRMEDIVKEHFSLNKRM